MSTARQERRDKGFQPLPRGWFNYYEDEGKILRTECPGILCEEVVLIENGNEEHQAFEYVPAEFDGGTLISATGANYIGTYADTFWEETKDPRIV